MNTQVSLIHQNLTNGLESHFKSESRRLLNRRAFEAISPIISPELLTDAETAWVKPADETWVDSISDNDQLNLTCLALFPVSLPKSNANGAMDSPLAPLLWFDIEAVDRINNRVKLARPSIQFNLSLLCDLSGLRKDASHFQTITKRFSQHGFNRKSLRWLAARLEEVAPSVDWRILSAPLQSIPWASLVAQSQNNQGATCYESAYLGVVESSHSQQAILTEVGKSIKDCGPDSPLGVLLKGAPSPTGAQSNVHVVSPRLSPNQLQAVQNVQRERVTVLDGQAGSGKSYAVAAAAINEVLQGRTVIISAPSTARLDRIADLIRKASGEAIPLIRSSGGGELRLLLNRIETLLNDDTPLENGLEIKQTFEKAFKKTIHALELERASISHPAFNHQATLGGLNRLVKRLVGSRSTTVPLDELQSQLAQLEHQAELALVRYLEASIYYRGQKACHAHRYNLYELVSDESSQHAHINGLDLKPAVWHAILQVMPIWIVDSRAIHRLLPFLEGMFDLGILEDSDQFDPSLGVPLLFRSQSALITGDRNIFDLPRPQDRLTKQPVKRARPPQSEDFNYGATSLFQMVHELSKVDANLSLSVLANHYRVNGTLIRVDHHLARGAISIDPYEESNPPRYDGTTHWHRVKAGPRDKSVQETEARALINWVNTHFETTAYQRLPQSIGIVSPFRDQVNCLTELAQEMLPIHVFPRHALRIGTPDRFEGNERDIMLCSFGTHDEPTIKEIRRLDDHSLVNVLFSRALLELHLFSSFDIAQFPPTHHLRLVHGQKAASHLPETKYPALHDALVSEGWLVESPRRINGVSVEFWITTEHINVGVLVVDSAKTPNDLQQQLAHARRIRTPIFVLDYTAYTARPSDVLNRFRGWLTRQGTDVVEISLAARSEAGQ